jgi:hypothetical protein
VCCATLMRACACMCMCGVGGTQAGKWAGHVRKMGLAILKSSCRIDITVLKNGIMVS